MFRNVSLVRRTFARQAHRRCLHEDSREEYLRFSLAKLPGADPRFGMDMTRAPGYELEPELDTPPAGKKKLADFAARHARLSPAQLDYADGYIWIGSVLYPSGISVDADVTFSWEIVRDDIKDIEQDVERVSDTSENDDNEPAVIEAKRRYTGGQARRIRKERAKGGRKRATRKPNLRPIRKPENDVPPEEDQ